MLESAREIDKFSAQLRREGDIAQNGRREVCTKGGVYKLAARISVRIAYKMGARMLYAPQNGRQKVCTKKPVVRVRAPAA